MTRREEFEKWCKTKNIDCSMSYGHYNNGHVRGFWLVWQAAKATPAVPQWIPVSERSPKPLSIAIEYQVYETLNNKVQHDYWVIPNDGSEPFWNYYGKHVTHWMPLPVAPDIK